MYFQPTSVFFSRQLSWFPKQKSPDIQNKQIQPKLALLARHWSSRKLQPNKPFSSGIVLPPPNNPPLRSLKVRPVKIGNPNCGNSSEPTIHPKGVGRLPSGSGPPGPQPSSGPPSRSVKLRIWGGWKGPQGGLGQPRFFSRQNSGEDGGQIMDFGSNCNDWKLGKTHMNEWSLKRRWLYQ